ncbi:MAG: hypothetical protein K2X81_18150 [Candidatus Obscuribacterales bacterium]|nr:hypothetical protein [Candidatus Obscuribacterales bacterium]
MPDFIKDKIVQHDLFAAKADLQSNTLLLEASLLGGGIKDGFISRRNQALENPGLTTLEFVGTAVIGAGLAGAHRAGGRWGIAADIAATALTCVAVGDASRRLVPTAYAMSDTYMNPQNYSENRALVARNLGTACFDYPLMAAGGFIGAKGVGLASRTFTSSVEGNPFFNPKAGSFGQSEIFNEPINYTPHETARASQSLKAPQEIPYLREVLLENQRELAARQAHSSNAENPFFNAKAGTFGDWNVSPKQIDWTAHEMPRDFLELRAANEISELRAALIEDGRELAVQQAKMNGITSSRSIAELGKGASAKPDQLAVREKYGNELATAINYHIQRSN